MKNTLYSMTGFGRGESSFGDSYVLVEIKSLNGKQLDLNLRIPPPLKPLELDIRNVIAQRLLRGSVDCTITLKMNGAAKPVVLNTDLIKYYYTHLTQVAQELQLEATGLLESILGLPEVVSPVTEVLDDNGWQPVQEALQNAIDDLIVHRQSEGVALQQDIELRIKNIQTSAKLVGELAPLRQLKLKENLQKKMEEWVEKEKIDNNRLEQELIYYIEKYDISEELLRLEKHSEFFLEILDKEEVSKGKKLGFLLQEIGREINTTGSKAYDADIQKLVVAMKDELEKAKEQVLNIL